MMGLQISSFFTVLLGQVPSPQGEDPCRQGEKQPSKEKGTPEQGGGDSPSLTNWEWPSHGPWSFLLILRIMIPQLKRRAPESMRDRQNE